MQFDKNQLTNEDFQMQQAEEQIDTSSKKIQ